MVPSELRARVAPPALIARGPLYPTLPFAPGYDFSPLEEFHLRRPVKNFTLEFHLRLPGTTFVDG
jgi:hypothetical protein